MIQRNIFINRNRKKIEKKRPDSKQSTKMIYTFFKSNNPYTQ